jgi:hypothetical protein
MDRELLDEASRPKVIARLKSTVGRWSASAAAVWLLTVAGCSATAPFTQTGFGPSLPANASVEEVVRRVNTNVERLQAWRSNDVRISGESMPVHLGGTIAVERPRNFHLTAGILGMDEEADFGSNTNWFWFWVKRGHANGQPSYVYQARHEDVPNSQMLSQIPFQPDWLMEALGVVPIDPQRVTLRLEPRGQIVNLISERLSPSGQTVKKVIRVDLQRGVVLSHSLYDVNGNLIARARLDRHFPDKATGVVLPHLIALEWPQADLKINLEIGQIDVNPTTIPPRNWEVPQKPYNPAFDIGALSRKQLQLTGATEGQTGATEGQNGATEGQNGRGSSSAVTTSNGPRAQFGAPSPLASPGRPTAPGSNHSGSWPEADSGSEWNKPIEAQPSSATVRASAEANPFDGAPAASTAKTPPPSALRSASADNPFADPPPSPGTQPSVRPAPASTSSNTPSSNGADPFESLPH